MPLRPTPINRCLTNNIGAPPRAQRNRAIALHFAPPALTCSYVRKTRGISANKVDRGGKWSNVVLSGGDWVVGGDMLLGTYEPKLDDKGRLILPAKYREAMSGGIVITRGQERCLYAFSRDEFKEILDRLRQATLFSKQSRDYLRVFLSGAIDEVPYKQGRVTIPAILRKYAGLGRELVVIGSGSKIEIWDAQAWEDYLLAQEDIYAELTEEVVPGM